jgi:phosphoglucosamine mutase
MTEYPQVLRNVKVGRGVQLDRAKGVWEAVRQAEKELGDDGRVLVRASGTEPMVRVMVEASSQDSAVGYADRLAEVVARELAS